MDIELELKSDHFINDAAKEAYAIIKDHCDDVRLGSIVEYDNEKEGQPIYFKGYDQDENLTSPLSDIIADMSEEVYQKIAWKEATRAREDKPWDVEFSIVYFRE